MKKLVLMTSIFALAASSAFAAALGTHTPTAGGAVAIYGGVDGPAALAAPTPLVKTSTGVNGMVDFPGTTAYLIVTKHTSGSKNFGTCNSVSNIYWQQVATGTLAAPAGITSGSALSSSFVGNGWTSY